MKKKIIAIAEQSVIAIFLSSVVLISIHFAFGKKIDNIISLIKITSIERKTNNKKETITKYNKETKSLTNYPLWGKLWGHLAIPSIDRNDIPIYQGDSLDIIKDGAGHHSGSYFPGEGGSIIIAAHNSVRDFYHLPEVVVGDTVTIRTDYGTFDYQVYKTTIIDEKDSKTMTVHDEFEEVILYTCYPVGGVGYKSKRFVVFAKLVLVEEAK